MTSSCAFPYELCQVVRHPTPYQARRSAHRIIGVEVSGAMWLNRLALAWHHPRGELPGIRKALAVGAPEWQGLDDRPCTNLP